MIYRSVFTELYKPQSIFGMATLNNKCWVWQGSLYRNGYAKIGRAGLMVHRIAYELTKGHVPVDMCPDHLQIVTLVENVMRGDSQHAINARKTHCKHGHELSGDNLYIHPKRNTRDCKTCRNSRNRELTKRRNV